MLQPKKGSAAVSKVVSATVLVLVLTIAGIAGVVAYQKEGRAKEPTIQATLQSNSDFSTLVNSTPVTTTLGLMTILQTAQSLGLTTLVEALSIAGLASGLDSSGPYTLLAPTNAAISVFSCTTPTDSCYANLQYFLSNQTAVIAVMEDTIVLGNFTTAQLVNAGSVTTQAGQTLPVTSVSGVVKVGAATITQKDILCSNGYIDVIDLILIPPGVTH